MVLDKLGTALRGTLEKIAKAVFVGEAELNELIKEIQKALISADVNVKLVFELSQKIKEKAKEKPRPGLTKKEQLINIVYSELSGLFGERAELTIPDKKPAKIMLVGLYGSGKTTTAGKLGKYLAKRGKKTALLGLDIHRPAAMTQLKQVAENAGLAYFIGETKQKPEEIYKKHEKELSKYDVVIIDTAGRDALSQELIEELKDVAETVKPDETLLVISADIGQAAQKQAEAFHNANAITGVIMSKMDGTARGGGALTACAVTGAPIKFIGVGEKTDDFETFNPQGFASRLLGMGDLEALLEKAKQAITEEDAQDMQEKLMKGEFTLQDLYDQMEAMSKMGPLGKIMEMVPGMGQLKMPKEALQVQEEKLKKWKYMMNSMTPEEKNDPDVLNAKRIERIAAGSGCSVQEVRELIKQYNQSKKLLKMMKGKPEKLMKKFGIKG